MKKFPKLIALFVATIALFSSCGDDLDDLAVPSDVKVNDFIWKGLNLYYYWQQDVPDLADDRFATQKELNDYLRTFSDPSDLFYNQLLYNYPTEDRFSFLTSDYSVLEGTLSGVTKNNGVDYRLFRDSNNPSRILGYVRYILPNSDAATKNIQRGDIFYAVNGVALTETNYTQLLSPETYTLNLADYDGGNFTPNGESVPLTKLQLAENPILVSRVFTYGSQKIGYLMYNGFYNEYDNQLNQVFGQFLAQGVNELVLDLRYNSGGSVQSATYLSSMITGQFSGQVFAKQQWNEKIEEYYADDQEQLINRFTATLGNNPINSLNLSRVFVLTTGSTASASELVINGLRPHINVTTIGTKTTGKNVGSVTLYDSPTFRAQGRSPLHKYAMQPICFKIVNSVGFGDYQNGITPSGTPLPEDLGNMGILGNAGEPLLAQAISQILGEGRAPSNLVKEYQQLKDRKQMQRFGTEMYLDEAPSILK